MAEETVTTEVTPAKRVRTMRVKFDRGYFPADGGKKIDADSSADLPLDEAKAVISSGIATRDDPLPE